MPVLKKKSAKSTKTVNSDTFMRILMYLLPLIIGIGVFCAIFILLCLYTYFTGEINTFTVIIGWFSVAFGGLLCGMSAHKKLGGKGFATGAVYGIIYCAVVLIIISFLSESESVSVFFGVPVSIFSAMLGGIIDSQTKR